MQKPSHHHGDRAAGDSEDEGGMSRIGLARQVRARQRHQGSNADLRSERGQANGYCQTKLLLVPRWDHGRETTLVLDFLESLPVFRRARLRRLAKNATP